MRVWRWTADEDTSDWVLCIDGKERARIPAATPLDRLPVLQQELEEFAGCGEGGLTAAVRARAWRIKFVIDAYRAEQVALGEHGRNSDREDTVVVNLARFRDRLKELTGEDY